MAKPKPAGNPTAETSGAESLESLVSAIRAADQSAARGAWEVGRALLAARPLVPFGEWESWLRSEFGWSRQYAARLMTLAESYPDELPSNASLWLLYEAAGVEVQLQDRIIDLVESAKLSRKESEAAIAAAKDRTRSAEERLAELNSADYLDKLRDQVRADLEAKANKADKVELADLNRANAELAGENKALKADRAKLEKSAKQADELRKNLETVNGNLTQANEQIAQLKREALKPREVRVEVPVVPEDYETLKADHVRLSGLAADMSRLADERAVRIAALESASAAGAVESVELVQLRETVERLRRQYEDRVLKFESVLADRRRLRARVEYLEGVLTSASVEFNREEVLISD